MKRIIELNEKNLHEWDFGDAIKSIVATFRILAPDVDLIIDINSRNHHTGTHTHWRYIGSVTREKKNADCDPEGGEKECD